MPDRLTTSRAAPSAPPAHLRSAVPCTPGARSLVEVLRQAAADRPDALYLDLLDEKGQPHERSFRAVCDGAERWARWLRARPVAPGARVALLLPTGDDFVGAFFGAQLAGAIPVPLPFPLGLGNPEKLIAGLGGIVASARPDLLVTVPHLAAAARGLLAAAGGGQLAEPGDVTDPGPGAPLPAVGPDDAALIQYASGRVFAPTGAVLTHGQVLASIFGLGTALRLTERDVALTWAPLVHDMGLIGGLLTSLYWRCPLHVMPPQTFLMHPDRWLKNISRFRVTLASAPNAAYQLCVKRVQDRHLAGVDLSSWRVALNGAETVRPATVEAFCARFAAAGFSRRAVVPSYGIAENTLATACPRLDAPYRTLPRGGVPVVSVGGPLAGQELAILDGEGAIAAEHALGEIAVRGPCVMSGYHGDEPATSRAIDARGWLHTGDLGFVAGGELYITGRKKDMVIKMGRNYYPSDVEGVLASFPGLGATLAFAAPNLGDGTDDLILLAESAPLAAEEEVKLGKAINAELLGRLGIRADTIALVAPGHLGGARDGEQRRARRDDYLAAHRATVSETETA